MKIIIYFKSIVAETASCRNYFSCLITEKEAVESHHSLIEIYGENGRIRKNG